METASLALCKGNNIRLTSSHRRLLVVSQRHQELRPGQLLIHGGEQRRLDNLIGGGGQRGGGSHGGGGGEGQLAELPSEVWRAETAILLQADAAVLTEQRTEDCRTDNTPGQGHVTPAAGE